MQFANYSANYDEFHSMHVHQHFFEYSLLQLLGDVTGKSVLDLGCGEGYYSRLIKAKGAARVVGVDISYFLIDMARIRERTSPLGIEYYTCDIAELCHPQKFDVVCMVYTINRANSHLHLRQMCKVAGRHLAPGGTLIATLCLHQSCVYLDFQNLGLAVSCLHVTSTSSSAIAKVFTSQDPTQLPVISCLNLFDKDTIESDFYEAGLRQIEWHPTSVSPQSGYTPEFWNDIVESRIFAGLTCVKEF